MFFNKGLLFLFLILVALKSSQAQLKAGDKAPEIVITDWIKNVPISKILDDKFVVIDFWATWCAPCLESVPHMNKLVKKNKYRSDLIFLSLTNEKVDKVNWLLKKVPFSSVVVTDTTGQTLDDYKINFIPSCVVIDDKNKIRWIGRPSYLTSEIISKIIEGNTVPSPEGDKTYLPEDVEHLYDSLYDRYKVYFEDNDLREYFSMGPITHRQQGASYSSTGKNHPYNELDVGDSLISRLSSFLGIADNQILLPENMVGYCISYCYKSVTKNTTKDVMDTILQHLHLKYTVSDSLMDVIQLEVSDQKVYNGFISDSIAHIQHSSSSDTYAAISHDRFSELVKIIQDRFQKVFILKDDHAFDKKMNITIKIDNMKNLKESLKAYGIKTTLVEKTLPVYKFVQIE